MPRGRSSGLVFFRLAFEAPGLEQDKDAVGLGAGNDGEGINGKGLEDPTTVL